MIRLLLIAFALTLAPAARSASVPAAIAGEELVARKPLRLETASGDLVIAFVSARCPCSSSHEPVLRALQERFAPKGFRFVAVHSNADETADEARAHFASSALPFAVIRDHGAKLADALGALKTPHVFVLKGGRIAYEGGVDDSQVAGNAKKRYLEDALVALSEGREPPVAKARALGCMINRD